MKICYRKFHIATTNMQSQKENKLPNFHMISNSIIDTFFQEIKAFVSPSKDTVMRVEFNIMPQNCRDPTFKYSIMALS